MLIGKKIKKKKNLRSNVLFSVSPQCGSRGLNVEKATSAGGEGLIQGDPHQRWSHRGVHGDHMAIDISVLKTLTTENIGC